MTDSSQELITNEEDGKSENTTTEVELSEELTDEDNKEADTTVADDFYVKETARKKSKTPTWLIVALSVMIVFLLVNIVLNAFVFTAVEVIGDSMNDTLTDGDVIYVNRLKTADYGDVVIIAGEKEDELIIKRVVAKGGDTVKIVDGSLLIKYADASEFVPIPETYAKYPAGYYYESTWLTEVGYTLSEDEVFYLGDNRDNSSDSRYSYMTCNKDQIKGVAGKFLIGLKGFTTFTFKVEDALRGFFGLETRLTNN